ncbi:hypothetical protein M6D93_05250 [Jatrophihabitans telluris]|uniref:Uncharacterized protein n=1 Tax=Jatrophihabitans telluris TaxID=2038343 RepID=A0ABY4R266_9ACTN|nr:hypothetical protein [Jatrophihabitans telluris]UQX89412.1 hypothetical protein M6D93_05250 [Jatrophihabitans telluris]
MNAAVSAFVQQSLGWNVDACRCSAAISVSFGGRASASAAPAVDFPTAGVAGHTGDVLTVSFSGNGPAQATAASGGVGSGSPLSALPTIFQPGAAVPGVAPHVPGSQELSVAVRQLISTLITANGQRAADLDPLAAFTGAGTSVSLQLVSTGPLSSCAASPACAVAIAVALDGTASATIAAPASCIGLVGTATAIALSAGSDATAAASRGSSRGCDATAAGSVHQVSAIAGNTGRAYGISLTAAGPATASAASGQLGDTVSADTTGSQGSVPLAVAISGSTGDTAGISIGSEQASTTVSSGDSGRAAATCAQCTTATSGLAQAMSGNTGSSYALAGAGTDATVQATSGASGGAAATAYGTGVKPGTGAKVVGKSGDTGDAFAVAVDLTTWVTVSTHSGQAGAVTSIAKGPKKDGSTGGGTVVDPSQPSHQRVDTGGHKPGHKPTKSLIDQGESVTSRPLTDPAAPPAGSSRPAVVPATSHRPATARTVTTSSASGIAGAFGPVLQAGPAPTAEVLALGPRPDVVPRAANQSGMSVLALVALPFIVLGMVLLVALATSHRRRRRWRS